MQDTYVQAKKLRYADRLLQRFVPLRKLFEQPYRLEALLTHHLGGRQAERLLCRLEMLEPTADARRHYLGEVHRAFTTRLTRLRPDAEESPFAHNLRLLTRLLGLATAERDILEVLLIFKREQELADLLDLLEPISHGTLLTLVAGLTGLRRALVQQALVPDAILLASGLVRLDYEPTFGLMHRLELAPGLLQVMSGPAHTEATLLGCFCQQSPSATITLDDCPTPTGEVAELAAMLRSALHQARKGVNILLYGPPSVGKTALARLLAAQVPATLYDLALTGGDGAPKPSRHRVTALALAQRLLQNHRQAILLMDDADTILNLSWTPDPGEDLRTGWLNRLLEDNAVPTLWIVNQHRGMDEALKRRFTTSVPCRPADPALRKRLWQTVARRHQVDTWLSDEVLESLARRYEVSVGLMEKALETVTLIHGHARMDQPTLERLLARAILLRDEQPEPPLPLASAPGASSRVPYDPHLLNTSLPVAEIVRGVQRFVALPPAARPAPGLCLLFHGLPGTGKTAFARHLAQVTERPLLCKRASDLLSKWLGETEQQLAAAFRQAQDTQGILLIDECDSFLHDRTRAQQRWEVTQVNELLSQIDRFTGGMVMMTTNRLDLLDAASLRRFVKVEFLPLTPAQRLQAVLTCATPLLPDIMVEQDVLAERLDELDGLTLGDIQVVCQQHVLFHEQSTVADLLRDLRAEVTHRRQRAAIGF